MSVPRIVFVVPGLLAGLLIPAVVTPHAAPPNSVGMVGTLFAKGTVWIHQGQDLTLFNNSTLVHVIGPGWDQHVYSPQRGNPVIGFHLMATDATYTTPPWTKVGKFTLTCTVHPGMNLTVIVVR
jgi:hypothetical protein